MEGFNKILSLFVGLFVVIIVGFLLVKQLKLQNSWPILGGKSTGPTPSVTVTPPSGQKVVAVNNTAEALKEKFGTTSKKTVVTSTTNETTLSKNTKAIVLGEKTAFEAVSNKGQVSNGYISTDTVTEKGGTTIIPNAKEIPETGLPTIFLPLAFSGLFGGVYLKRKFQ